MLSYSTATISNGYSTSQSTTPVLFSVTGCRTPDRVFPVMALMEPSTSAIIGQYACGLLAAVSACCEPAGPCPCQCFGCEPAGPCPCQRLGHV